MRCIPVTFFNSCFPVLVVLLLLFVAEAAVFAVAPGADGGSGGGGAAAFARRLWSSPALQYSGMRAALQLSSGGRRRRCTSYAQVSVRRRRQRRRRRSTRSLGHDRCSSHLHTFTGSYEAAEREAGEGEPSSFPVLFVRLVRLGLQAGWLADLAILQWCIFMNFFPVKLLQSNSKKELANKN